MALFARSSKFVERLKGWFEVILLLLPLKTEISAVAMCWKTLLSLNRSENKKYIVSGLWDLELTS